MLQEMIIESFENMERLAELNQKELDEVGKKGQAKRKSRIIVHDDKYIHLYQYHHNKHDIFTYTPELYSYLATPSKCSFKVNKRGRTQIDLREYHRAGHRFLPMANRFAYYYNEYCNKAGMPIDQFEREYRSISDMTFVNRKTRKEVDHANDDIDNNCNWNLSLVPSAENGNGGKGRLLANIKPPYYCFIAVMPDGDYRVEFGYIVPKEDNTSIIGQALFVHCQTIKDLNSFLGSVYRDFVAIDQLPVHLERWGNPQYLQATFKEQKIYYSGNFETAAYAAERLLGMDATEFTEWDGTLKWTALLP